MGSSAYLSSFDQVCHHVYKRAIVDPIPERNARTSRDLQSFEVRIGPELPVSLSNACDLSEIVQISCASNLFEFSSAVKLRTSEEILDFFAGSGTTGVAAARNGRSAVLIDQSPEACALMRKRLAISEPTAKPIPKKKRPGQ